VTQYAVKDGGYIVKDGGYLTGCCCAPCVDDGVLYRLLIPCGHGISCETGALVALPCLRVLAEGLPPADEGTVYRLLGICYRYGPLGTDCELAAFGCPSGAGQRRMKLPEDVPFEFVPAGCIDDSCLPKRVGAVAIECATGALLPLVLTCGPCVVSECRIYGAIPAVIPDGFTPLPTPAPSGAKCCDCAPCEGGPRDQDSRNPGPLGPTVYCCCGHRPAKFVRASSRRVFESFQADGSGIINTVARTMTIDAAGNKSERYILTTVTKPLGTVIESNDQTFETTGETPSGCSESFGEGAEILGRIVEEGGNQYRGRACHSWSDGGSWDSARDGSGGFFRITASFSYVVTPDRQGCNRAAASSGSTPANPFAGL
jgi:hypothetical protein